MTPPHAVILAAGLGRRMWPYTEERHKSLLTIADTTVLGRIVEGLTRIGVVDMTVVTGYRAEEVRGFLTGNYPDSHFHFVHNGRFGETNNITSLALALDSISGDSDVVVIECDLIFDPEILDPLVDQAYAGRNLALASPYRPGMDGTVVSIEDGLITHVHPPHLQSSSFDYGDKYKTLNIYRFTAEFCRSVFRDLLSYYARSVDDNCFYELVLGLLVYMQREVVTGVIVGSERWAEIDDPNDFLTARFEFAPQERAAILEATKGGYWSYDILDFSYIRNCYYPTPAMVSSLRQFLPDLLQNYGSSQVALDQKMALALRTDASRLRALNGASQLYPILARRFRGAKVLRPDPTFGEYSRVFPEASTYADRPGVDLDELARRARDHDLVVVVNPNNPTGTTLGTGRLFDLAAAEAATTFIVDESFIEFSGEPSLIDLLSASPLDNVIVLKSLSKTFGVPGLRLGVVFSTCTETIAEVGEDLPIWNLNSVAEFLLDLVLKTRPELEGSYHRTRLDRERLADGLARLPCIEEVHPSGGNFVLVRCAGWMPTGQEIVERLLVQDRIYVKDVSGRMPSAGTHLRVAVRSPDDNNRFLQALRRLAECCTR